MFEEFRLIDIVRPLFVIVAPDVPAIGRTARLYVLPLPDSQHSVNELPTNTRKWHLCATVKDAEEFHGK